MVHITQTDSLNIAELQIYTSLSETQLYHYNEPLEGLVHSGEP